VPDQREVGVVIATRNRPQRLAAVLASLRSQTVGTARFEVVVVDDGSTGETARVLADEAARGELALRTIRRERSGGPAAAREEGWRATDARLIAFTDDDCVASPGWLAAGVAAWAGDDEVFVQGRTTPIESERHLLGPRAYSYDITAPDEDYQTCNMFYPRSLLERLDGFDAAHFPAVGEDADLGWRARAIGARPVFAPDAHVQHAVVTMDARGTLRRGFRWGGAVPLYVRHPELRRKRLLYRVFWNWFHMIAVRALVAALLPWRRSLWPLKAWLAGPWLRDRARDPESRRIHPGRAAWFAVADTVELAGMVRGSVRARRLVL
jgi:glycosyltransferase involved in cell wall biosynthesis